MEFSLDESTDELLIELLWVVVTASSPFDEKLGISFVQAYPAVASVGCKYLRGSECS